MNSLRLLYSASFLQRFVFWYAIEKAFYTLRGLSVSSVVVITILFSVITFLGNVPFGILADKWSRKGVLGIGSVCLAICSLICAYSTNVLSFAVGMGFWGLYYAAVSGTYDAVLYDKLIEQQGNADQFERRFGRLQVVNTIAFVASSLLSSVVTHTLSLQACYLLSIPFILTSLIPIILFREPTLHKHQAAQVALRQQLRSLLTIGRSAKVRPMLWAAVLGAALVTLVSEFGALWFVSLRLRTELFGPVVASLQLSLGISGLLAPRIKQRGAYIGFLLGLICLSAASLILRNLIAVYIAEIVLLSGVMTIGILISKRLHDAVSAGVRSKTSSIVGAAGYATFIILAVIIGSLLHYVSIFAVGWLVLVLALLMAWNARKVLVAQI